MSRLNKDINIIKQILHFGESSTPELDFGVRDYLEGKFEGWMKRKGYDAQDASMHDWFMAGYWNSDVKPANKKDLEAYNYGKRLSSGKSVKFSEAFMKTPIGQISEGDIIIFGNNEYKVTLLSKSGSPDSFILKAESLDGSDKLDIELKYDTTIPVKNKVNIIGDMTEFASGRKNLSVARAINDRLEDLKKFYMNTDMDKASKMGEGADTHLKNIKFEIDALNKCKSILVNNHLWLDN